MYMTKIIGKDKYKMNIYSTIGMILFIGGMFMLNNSGGWNTPFSQMSSLEYWHAIQSFAVILISFVFLFHGVKQYKKDHEKG